MTTSRISPANMQLADGVNALGPGHSARVRSHRFALISAVVILGLTSCGSRTNSTAATPNKKLPKIIHVGSQGQSGHVKSTSAGELEADVPAGADSKIAAPYSVTYVYGGQTIDLTSPVGSWFFPVGKNPSKDDIAKLAAALGVTGEPVELPADQGGGWSVGPLDYSAPHITFSADAMNSWWYDAGSTASSSPQVDCGLIAIDPAVDVATTGDVAPVEPAATEVASTEPAAAPAVPVAPLTDPGFVACPAPTPPVNVPTKEQAEAKARELFAAVGLDVSGYTLETYADEWGANVTAFMVLDGIKTYISQSVGFGEEGKLVWASGFLGTPERGGDYTRIGIDAAVARLNEQAAGLYSGGPSISARVGTGSGIGLAGSGVVTPSQASQGSQASPPVLSDQVTTPDTAVDAEQPVPETVPADCAFDGPNCPITVPVPSEPLTITLTDVKPSLEQIWDADGTVWLVPGYSFSSVDNGVYSVTAIDSSFIQTDAPITSIAVEPAIDPVPVPVPSVDPGQDPAAPASPDCAIAAWSTKPTADEFNKGLLGMCPDAAVQDATTFGFEVRIVRKDGVDLPGTADFRESRFNVAVVNGVITEVVSVG